jgi:hypothetical protein
VEVVEAILVVLQVMEAEQEPAAVVHILVLVVQLVLILAVAEVDRAVLAQVLPQVVQVAAA